MAISAEELRQKLAAAREQKARETSPERPAEASGDSSNSAQSARQGGDSAQKQKLDVRQIKQLLLERIAEVAQYLYPNGKKEGNHWRVGSREGEAGKSFDICIAGEKAGFHGDFAEGGKHSKSPLDLWMGAHKVDFGTALRETTEWLGEAPAQASQPRSKSRDAQTNAGKAEGKSNPFPWKECVLSFTDSWVERIAQWRGLSVAFVRELRDRQEIGVYQGKVAFPVRNDGVIVGVHFRLNADIWNYEPKGQIKAAPIIFGELKAGKDVQYFESTWDGLAYMDKTGERDGILITRGAGNGKFAALIPEGCAVYAWKQNDAEKKGRRSGDDWLETSCEHTRGSCTIKMPRIPVHDLNDWTRDGATKDDILEAKRDAWTVRQAVPSEAEVKKPYAIRGQSIVDYSREEIDESQNLLGKRWLERGRGGLVTGPRGIGKSTFIYQATACWACGVISFGIKPPHPLRIGAIQTEDSHNDLIEMSRCVDRLNLSDEQLKLVQCNAHIETINDAIGRGFIDKLDSFLEQKPCDLIILNPLSDFIPGDLTDEKEVKYFLRGLLNPLLNRHHCGVLCVQPTPKTNRDSTEKYSWFDWQYWGAGSAEFARWARCDLALAPTASRGTYRFIAAKRFEKIGWTASEYWYAHSKVDEVTLWVLATEEQKTASKKGKDLAPEDLYAVLPDEKELLREEIRIFGKQYLKLGKNTTDDFLKILVKYGRLQPREYPRFKARPEIRFFKSIATVGITGNIPAQDTDPEMPF